MRRLISVLLLAGLAPAALASGSDGAFMRKATNNLHSSQSLHRGAKYFMNYCAGCHSAQYVRYERIAADLNLGDDQVTENLMFNTDKIAEVVRVAMSDADSNTWFGTQVPDLSLVSRSRGVDWIYSYLLSFYADESAVWGVNNLVLPNASMPHVLADLQGLRRAIFETHKDADGFEREVFVGFEQITEGRLSEAEYERVVADIVNFLEYIGEPVKLKRQSIGYKVIGYLLILLVLVVALKKEYWKDVT